MSDQQEQKQISFDDAAPAESAPSVASVPSPVAVPQPVAAESKPAQEQPAPEAAPASASGEPKAKKAVPKVAKAEAPGSDAAPVDAAPADPKASADDSTEKPKRARRSTRKASDDGDAAAKPRARRSTRTKRIAPSASEPISDEVAQARALAQISQAQVVRAQRRAAEREAAALNQLVAEAEARAEEARVEAGEEPIADAPKPARAKKRTAKRSPKATQIAEAIEPAESDKLSQDSAPEASSAATPTDSAPGAPAATEVAPAIPVVDPALRPHRRGRKPKAFVEAEKAAAAALAAQQRAAEEEAVAAKPDSASISADAPAEDVRPGRSRRSAKRAFESDAPAAEPAFDDPAVSEESPADASVEKPKAPKGKRAKRDKAEPQQQEVSESADSQETAGQPSDDARSSRRQHKRERTDERTDDRKNRNDRKDDAPRDRKEERRQRQRDRKQRNKDRFNAPSEPTLSRDELSAMKVAELREKAKEFDIETTGKKKAELIEEIYTTAARAEGFRDIKGILELSNDGSGHILAHGYMKSREDGYVSAGFVRSNRLRAGDIIEGTLRPMRANDKRPGLAKLISVNGRPPEEMRQRPHFKDLTPVYPNEPLRMEHGKDSITGRAIDIVSPIGKGQRGLIVSPPKAGKTTILKKICQSISINNPEVTLICLLVDERPEEVTDMQRSIKGEVVASTFDMPADNHTHVAELVIERAKRIVELGGDVVVVLDSITRLARAYNLAAPASGRILSGGVDSAALYPPKRFLGAARNIENGGSLTILASALVETGSKMDEVIFEEFKGTGNMELKLDRELADRRIFPAIDPIASGTRNEDLLVPEQMRPFVFGLRRVLAGMNGTERAAASFIKGLKGTNTNEEFLLRAAKKHSDFESQY